MNLHIARVAVLAAATFVLSACSGEEGGTALPTGPPPSSTAGSMAPSDSSPTPDAAKAPTSELDPCSLLSAADLAQFGEFSEGVPEDADGVRGCKFDRKIENASDDTVGVGVNIRDSQGVDEVRDVGDGVQNGTVGSGRKAVKTSGNGVCLIALAVGENSRVDVGGVGTSQEEICEIADAVAEIVEPKLPEG